MVDVPALLKDYIHGPAHVGFVVEDLARALANVRRVYGLADADIDYQPPPGEPAATRFAFFTVAGLVFEYIEPCSPHFRKILLEMPSGGGGINHLAWRVTDLAAALDTLALQGIVPGHVTPDGMVAIGDRKMVYLDPTTTGGQVIELIEYPGET